jgi:hypothetical protein
MLLRVTCGLWLPWEKAASTVWFVHSQLSDYGTIGANLKRNAEEVYDQAAAY